jgi:outer membrane protein
VKNQIIMMVGVATCVVLLSIFALQANDTPITLSRALVIALEQNHEIRAMKNSLLARKADVGVARSYLLPQLSLEERFSRTNNPPGVFMSKLNQERFSQSDFSTSSLNDPGPVSDLQTLVSVDQPLFVGKAILGYGMARKEHEAGIEEYGRKKEEVVLQVVRGYLAVRTAAAFVKTAQAGITDAGEQLRIAEARYRNNLGLYSDVLRARTAGIEAEQRLVSARKNLSVAKNSLGMILGSADPYDIADEHIEFSLKVLDYYRNVAGSRKDVLAAEMRYENAKSGVRVAESGYLPTVGVRASYQLNDHNGLSNPEGESWWLMGVLKWDLFDGAGREYERSKAIHKQAEADEQLRGLRRLVSFKIEEAYLSAEEAAKNLELAKAALESAQEGRKLVKGRFENALSPLIDLLDAQLNLDHERANVIARENEYLSAIVRTAFESGTILKDLGVE